MDITIEAILWAAEQHSQYEYSTDLVALGKSIYDPPAENGHGPPKEVIRQRQLHEGAVIARDYYEMWYTVGAAENKVYIDDVPVGPFFLDEPNRIRNPKVTPLDHLRVMKEYLRHEANGVHSGTPVNDWVEAEHRLASHIRATSC